MTQFVNRILAWYESRDRGASAVEYALLLILIVAVLVTAFFWIGNETAARLDNACDDITAVNCP